VKREPMNPQLYALCREGTDPAIDRALEDARDPIAKLKRKLTTALEEAEWFDELQDKVSTMRTGE